MEILLDLGEGGEPKLLSPDDFTAFHVTVHGFADEAARRAALDRVGAEVDADHRAIALDDVRAWAGSAAAEPGWEEGFAKMIAYAASKGWIIGDAIRAHVERQPG